MVFIGQPLIPKSLMQRAFISQTPFSTMKTQTRSVWQEVCGWWGIRNDSETSEICLIFGISLVSDRKSMLFSFLEMLVGHYIALMWQPFLYQNSNSTGCSTILCISLWFIGVSQNGQALASLVTNMPQLPQTTWGKIRKTRHSIPASTAIPQTGQAFNSGEKRLSQVIQTK